MENNAYCMTASCRTRLTTPCEIGSTNHESLYWAVIQRKLTSHPAGAVRPRAARRGRCSVSTTRACKITFGFREQNRDLEWKDVLTVQVLMKAVVVTQTHAEGAKASA